MSSFGVYAHANEACINASDCREVVDSFIGKNDYEGALPYHESACRPDDGMSCFPVGLQYETG
ncbi:hypothetical protein [Ruminobacter sp. RM87]|uniref:hypothetical protein n=1 Tax=Ruminobacter sp. RM87 TaxID=1200567 RepID=UPI0012FC8F1A|nr:hypothetical protein [Ruminobacter sp. RM87]